MNNNIIIFNPLEQFSIFSYLNFEIPEFTYYSLNITNFAIYSFITISLVIILFISGNNKERLISNNWYVGIESLYHTAFNLVNIQIGKKGEIYFPFIFTLFIYILSANIISLIPYSFAITAHFIFTLALSLSILIGITIIGFNNHKLHYLSILVPNNAPLMLLPFLIILEFISYIAKGVSHGLRLGINLLAGHCLMIIIAGFIYNIINISLYHFFFVGTLVLPINIAILILEIAIAFIQAYVFTILTTSYIKDSIDLH